MPHADSSQKAAIVGAAARTLAVVFGGPGTGKTTTAAAIVAAKLRILGKTGRISLVAPTGKAAVRLNESFQAAVSNMDQPDTRLNDAVATTIHRQLNRLSESELVLIDEASMVSLDLFDRLLKALSPDSHIILMGDPDQLASVEAGNILKTIVESASLSSHCFKLTDRHRVQGQETLATLQDLCLGGDYEGFIECLHESGFFWEPNQSADRLKTCLFHGLKAYLDQVKTGERIEAPAFQCLTAINEGIGGRRFVNHLIQAECQQLGLRGVGDRLLVTENQPAVGIFNGDIGVVIDSNDTQNPRVRFDTLLAPLMRNQLGWVEPAWAISIHRSQGSEYQSVLVCLPEPSSNGSRFRPSRELLYTALTRAKQSVGLFASDRMLKSALQQTTQRVTCLGYFLNE
jgi:exodeoxyribonuclease V alpha subunit